ncbi:hypothetical protein L210DRAFT_820473, partial [Boletus edulis BED1]
SASWTDTEVNFLIDQVISCWAEGGIGLNFKKSFWQSISESPALAKPEKGGSKTRSGCKEKWAHIKKTFEAVNALVNTSSSLAYTPDSAANVGVESDETVWAKFIQQFPAAAPCKNKGWPFYDKLKPIMPTKSK